MRLLVLSDDLIIQVTLKFKTGDGGSRLLASATREPRSRDNGGCTIIGFGHACSRASTGDGGFPIAASAARVATHKIQIQRELR